VWGRKNRRKSAAVKIPSVNIVVFGSGGVGKTSLVRRYLYNCFQEKYQPTIEDDYRKVISYKGNLCDLTILDTTGTHQFPAMRNLAIRNGDGFIIVYAIDDKLSLGGETAPRRNCRSKGKQRCTCSTIREQK